jgi:hypothetical protein
MRETWKPVAGYEGSYEVSDRGNVRSVDRLVHFSDGRVRRYKSQARTHHTDNFGYKKVTLKVNGASWRAHIHVLVAEAFIGPRPDGMVVCHCDGDHLNNRPGNLRYDTVQGNIDDTERHGTRAKGERQGAAILTADRVKAIRALRGKLTQQDIADRFGTSKTNVCNIQRGNRWQHLDKTV